MLSKRLLQTSAYKRKQRGDILTYYFGFEIFVAIFTTALGFVALITRLPGRTGDTAAGGGQAFLESLLQFGLNAVLLAALLSTWRLKRGGVWLLIGVTVVTLLFIAWNYSLTRTLPWFGVALIATRVFVMVGELRPRWAKFEPGFW